MLNELLALSGYPLFLNYAPGLSESETKEALPLDRELYFHQEKALRKTIGENRNIVIATGTGSGKTEGFLFPIIDHLLKERASGSLGPRSKSFDSVSDERLGQ